MPEAPEVAYFLGYPIRRYDDTEWGCYLERWQFTGPPGLKLGYPGDKCDVARSRHIGAAKGLLPLDDKGLGFGGTLFLKQPAAATLQLDSDVWPRMSLLDTLRLVHQDFEAGFDVVTAPTVSNETLTVMAWTKDGTIPSDRCVEVDKCAFGFVAFSPRFIREVKPEGEELFWPGTPQVTKVPLYCHFAPNEDDSTSFSKLVRSQGFKLGVDARIHVTHRKAIELDPTTARWCSLLKEVIVGTGHEAPGVLDQIFRFSRRMLEREKEAHAPEEGDPEGRAYASAKQRRVEELRSRESPEPLRTPEHGDGPVPGPQDP